MELLVPYDPDRGPGWYALWAAVADDRIATHEKHLAALLLYDATASRIGIVYRHENIGTLIQILRTMAPYLPEADVDTGGILDMSLPETAHRALRQIAGATMRAAIEYALLLDQMPRRPAP